MSDKISYFGHIAVSSNGEPVEGTYTTKGLWEAELLACWKLGKTWKELEELGYCSQFVCLTYENVLFNIEVEQNCK